LQFSISYRLRRFHDLGLKWNPYRVATADELRGFYVPDASGAAIASEIARSAERFTQIIGEAGWGKSTLLAAVRNELSAAGVAFQHVYLGPQGPFLVDPPQPPVRHLLIDEAQRLSRRGRRIAGRWLQSEVDRRLIVTTHEDLRGSVAETPVTISLRTVDVASLPRLFRRRIEWAGGAPARFVLPPETAEWLIARSRGNLRFLEMVLYEFFQSIAPAERIVVEGLEPFARQVERFFPDQLNAR
jgi:hypothetical protein